MIFALAFWVLAAPAGYTVGEKFAFDHGMDNPEGVGLVVAAVTPLAAILALIEIMKGKD